MHYVLCVVGSCMATLGFIWCFILSLANRRFGQVTSPTQVHRFLETGKSTPILLTKVHLDKFKPVVLLQVSLKFICKIFKVIKKA